MCDYSLEHVASRPARVGDELVSTKFPNTYTVGFAAAEDVERNVAVCVPSGTELAFAKEVTCNRTYWGKRYSTGHKVARFRQVNNDRLSTHHDALEFPDGRIVLLTKLSEGQCAIVLQLPASGPNDSTEDIKRHEPSAAL